MDGVFYENPQKIGLLLSVRHCVLVVRGLSGYLRRCI